MDQDYYTQITSDNHLALYLQEAKLYSDAISLLPNILTKRLSHCIKIRDFDGAFMATSSEAAKDAICALLNYAGVKFRFFRNKIVYQISLTSPNGNSVISQKFNGNWVFYLDEDKIFNPDVDLPKLLTENNIVTKEMGELFFHNLLNQIESPIPLEDFEYKDGPLYGSKRTFGEQFIFLENLYLVYMMFPKGRLSFGNMAEVASRFSQTGGPSPTNDMIDYNRVTPKLVKSPKIRTLREFRYNTKKRDFKIPWGLIVWGLIGLIIYCTIIKPKIFTDLL